MSSSSLAGKTTVIVFILMLTAGGYASCQRDAGPAVATPSAALPAHAPDGPSALYGRITTVGGTTYQGRMRFGGDEEAFWGNYFNGFKEENPWAVQVPPAQRSTVHRSIRVFGMEISTGERQMDLSRPFMARFGDIARIESVGEGVGAVLERGIAYDPRVRVTLKSGTEVDLDRLRAGDFDDGVRVWDDVHGTVDLGPRQIRTIEFLPSVEHRDLSDRLFGTVHTRQGAFTGFIQWDRKETLGRDVLAGRTDAGEVRLRFGTIHTIRRQGPDHVGVTLRGGREVVLSGTRATGPGNRGIYVDDVRYGRVLVSWSAFERVDFSRGRNGPAYGDFPPGQSLMGTVTTRAGRRLAGRLVFDLDESETTETLDAPSQGVNYTIPFGLVAAIVLPDGEARTGVILQNGEKLRLERAGDLGERNGGMLVFSGGRQRPQYVPWSDVARIDLKRPSEMYPRVGVP